jgi:hypothetical protein
MNVRPRALCWNGHFPSIAFIDDHNISDMLIPNHFCRVESTGILQAVHDGSSANISNPHGSVPKGLPIELGRVRELTRRL